MDACWPGPIASWRKSSACVPIRPFTPRPGSGRWRSRPTSTSKWHPSCDACSGPPIWNTRRSARAWQRTAFPAAPVWSGLPCCRSCDHCFVATWGSMGLSSGARGRLQSHVDRLESEIGANGYLVGDRFGVADLAAAAVMTAMIRPPEFPYPLPEPWPPELLELRASVAHRPGFRWVLDIYARHRGTSCEIRSLRAA